MEIRDNKLIGHFVEISAKFASRMDALPQFFFRQELSDRRRYKTEELITLESTLGRARADVIAMELQLFDDLCDQVLKKK